MVQSVDRALQILTQFGNEARELGVTELSQSLGLSKSATHALVKTLEQRGFLAQNPDNSRYRLGLKVYELGTAYISGTDLPYAARVPASKLAAEFGAAVHVAIYAGGMAVFILRTDAKLNTMMFGRMGATIPAHATAVGKVLLADLPPDEQERYLAEELHALTKKTLTDPAMLREELKQISARGYSIDNEESLDGNACVAAPIRVANGRVAAAISLTGAAPHILGEQHERIVAAVTAAAKEVSRTMGYLRA
ncbi:MAG: IclR family transcriptional regulator [Solirubrobacterales bacterium]